MWAGLYNAGVIDYMLWLKRKAVELGRLPDNITSYLNYLLHGSESSDDSHNSSDTGGAENKKY
jgi:hypothetical protein